MDIFRVLTRGASLKKSKDLITDYSLPTQNKKTNKNDSRKDKLLDNQVSKEIDFFKTNKFKRKLDELNEEEQQDEDHDDINNNNNNDDDDGNIKPKKITTEDEAKKLRKLNKSKITGDDIPLPIGSFHDLISRFEMNKQLLLNLEQSGFDLPTAIQSETIPISLFNRDLIACAPTGSGKTLAFLIPLLQQIIQLKGNGTGNRSNTLKGLIISPTKELSKQIYEVALKLSKNLNINVTLLTKSLNSKYKNKIITKNKYELIITTPLRLIDLMNNLDSTDVINFQNLKFLIMDEADKLFDKNFILQTDEILSKIVNGNSNLQKLMFSATIPSNIEEIAKSIMINPLRVIIGHKEAANESIEQKLIYTGNEEGKLLAIRQLIQQGEFKPPIIIFLQSITRAKALYNELLYDNLRVEVLHSEKTQYQRDQIIENFKKGEIWCLICTDVLSRGLDFKKINLVINYDVPLTSQDYVHRIGRTGRGGQIGKALTLYTNQDNQLIKPILNVMKQNNIELQPWLEKLVEEKTSKRKKIKKNIERKEISTVPKIVKQKKRQKLEMIQASKIRKENE
ncbi:hypothetical protein WICMUC_002514 [Wickerhamomyces mucosus]|uniref:RNA helicase n=1 Tax=Wickerhamomyces mucosus TaxID=1378264 RepID=A0A9P8PP59_9ASCO|nr:hypothetical protein WICMUC_002514 [Wickerhamomyces mucosus]